VPSGGPGPGGHRASAGRSTRYSTVALVLDELGNRGTVGLEAWASGDSEHALARFREAFTVPGTRTGALP
jgi:hydroxypyruvate isomerase